MPRGRIADGEEDLKSGGILTTGTYHRPEKKPIKNEQGQPRL